MDFDAKDFIAASVTKSRNMEDSGLKIAEYNGDFVIYEVGGIFEMCTPLPAGTRLLKLQDKDISEYESLDQIRSVLQKDKKISVEGVKLKGAADWMSVAAGNDSSNSEPDGVDPLHEGLPKEAA